MEWYFCLTSRSARPTENRQGSAEWRHHPTIFANFNLLRYSLSLRFNWWRCPVLLSNQWRRWRESGRHETRPAWQPADYAHSLQNHKWLKFSFCLQWSARRYSLFKSENILLKCKSQTRQPHVPARLDRLWKLSRPSEQYNLADRNHWWDSKAAYDHYSGMLLNFLVDSQKLF